MKQSKNPGTELTFYRYNKLPAAFPQNSKPGRIHHTPKYNSPLSL